MGRNTAVLMFVSLLLATGSVGAGDDDAVPLYTNADLAPLPAPTGPEPQPRRSLADDPGWAFVERFLTSHRAWFESERAVRLELQRIRAEADAARREERYALPLAPYAYGWYPNRRPRPRPGPVNPHERVRRLYSGASGGTIRPIHARPGGRIEPQRAR